MLDCVYQLEENLKLFTNGKPFQNIVDKKRGY